MGMMATRIRRSRAACYVDEDGARLIHIISAEIRPREVGVPLTIRHEPAEPGALELSLSGELWPARADWRRDRRYAEAMSYGQNLESLRAAIYYDRLVFPPDALTVHEAQTVARIWDRWHLNGMNGLCAHQPRSGWTCTRTGAYAIAQRPDPWTCAECGRHRWDCEAPCIEAPGTHHYQPAPLVGPLPITRKAAVLPCAACGKWPKSDAHGYRAGSAWLFEPLPVGVLEDLERIFGGGLA